MLLNEKVLEVEGEKANDGTEIDLWQDSEKPHQCWQLTKVAEDQDTGEVFYTIGHPNSPMVMEAPGPWHPGQPIVMRDYGHDGDDKSHRQWKLVPVPNQTNAYEIVNRRSKLVIDVTDGAAGTGQVRQYESWKAPDDRQHWKLRTAVGTVVTPTAKVPVAVELFHHPLGQAVDHPWTKDQRSVVLTNDTPYLNAADKQRVNPISDFPSQVSAIRFIQDPTTTPVCRTRCIFFSRRTTRGRT